MENEDMEVKEKKPRKEPNRELMAKARDLKKRYSKVNESYDKHTGKENLIPIFRAIRREALTVMEAHAEELKTMKATMQKLIDAADWSGERLVELKERAA